MGMLRLLIQSVPENHACMSDLIPPLITKCYKIPGVAGILLEKKKKKGWSFTSRCAVDELRIPLRFSSEAREKHTEVNLKNHGKSLDVHGSLNWNSGKT